MLPRLQRAPQRLDKVSCTEELKYAVARQGLSAGAARGRGLGSPRSGTAWGSAQTLERGCPGSQRSHLLRVTSPPGAPVASPGEVARCHCQWTGSGLGPAHRLVGSTGSGHAGPFQARFPPAPCLLPGPLLRHCHGALCPAVSGTLGPSRSPAPAAPGGDPSRAVGDARGPAAPRNVGSPQDLRRLITRQVTRVEPTCVSRDALTAVMRAVMRRPAREGSRERKPPWRKPGPGERVLHASPRTRRTQDTGPPGTAAGAWVPGARGAGLRSGRWNVLELDRGQRPWLHNAVNLMCLVPRNYYFKVVNFAV